MHARRDHKPKLPAQQLLILAVARFADPVGLTSVNPYLPEMIESFGVKKNDIARWAGLVGATFSAVQGLTAVPWGWASDKIGRKPTILMGLMATLVGFIIWGFATNLYMALAIRAVQGAASGNVGIIRTVVAEMVTEKELQPKAFALMPLVWCIGSVFGPSFGGFFAQPARQWPQLFKGMPIFNKFPFLLPNLIAAIIFFVCFVITALFLKETLERKKGHRDWGLRLGDFLRSCVSGSKQPTHSHGHHIRTFSDIEASENLLEDADEDEKERHGSPTVTKAVPGRIVTSQTMLVLVVYSILAFHNTAGDQALPVFLNYPRQQHTPENTQLPFKFSGGYGLSSEKIGTIFTVHGVATGVVQFLVFPPICRFFGASRLLNIVLWIFPFVYLATPYLALMPDTWLQYVALLSLMFIKGFANVSAFPCITILLTNAAPSLKVLGTLNGIATMTSGLAKACGPAILGVFFTMGVHRGYMILPWWLLSVSSVFGAVPALWIREGEGPSHSEADYEILADTESPDLKPERDNNDVIPAQQLGLPMLSTSGSSALLAVPPDLFQVDSDTESECPPPPPPEDRGGNTTSIDSPAIKLERLSFTKHKADDS